MSECTKCLNAVPALSACGKRPCNWIWPHDFECIMTVLEFPEAHDCEWFIEMKKEDVV